MPKKILFLIICTLLFPAFIFGTSALINSTGLVVKPEINYEASINHQNEIEVSEISQPLDQNSADSNTKLAEKTEFISDVDNELNMRFNQINNLKLEGKACYNPRDIEKMSQISQSENCNLIGDKTKFELKRCIDIKTSNRNPDCDFRVIYFGKGDKNVQYIIDSAIGSDACQGDFKVLKYDIKSYQISEIGKFNLNNCGVEEKTICSIDPEIEACEQNSECNLFYNQFSLKTADTVKKCFVSENEFEKFKKRLNLNDEYLQARVKYLK